MMKDCELIAGLKEQRNTAYELLYASYYPVIEHLVRRNGGTGDDARDVFQETLLVLMDKVPQPGFELTSSLKTYIYSIASRIWLKKLRQARHTAGLPDDIDLQETMPTGMELNEEQTGRQNFLQQLLDSVTGHCQVLLMRTFLEETSRDVLIAEMGYKNTHTFDNQKYKCLLQARKVSSRPGFG